MNRQDSYRRAERAYRLRCVGRTWQEIADAEGFKTRRGAHRTLCPVTHGPRGKVKPRDQVSGSAGGQSVNRPRAESLCGQVETDHAERAENTCRIP